MKKLIVIFFLLSFQSAFGQVKHFEKNNSYLSNFKNSNDNLFQKSTIQQNVIKSNLLKNLERNSYVNIKFNYTTSSWGYGPGFTFEYQYNSSKNFSSIFSVNPVWMKFKDDNHFGYFCSHISSGIKILFDERKNSNLYVSPCIGLTLDTHNSSYLSFFPIIGWEKNISKLLAINIDLKPNFYFSYGYIPSSSISIETGLNFNVNEF